MSSKTRPARRFKNGALSITLPKSERATQNIRRIAINGNCTRLAWLLSPTPALRRPQAGRFLFCFSLDVLTHQSSCW